MAEFRTVKVRRPASEAAKGPRNPRGPSRAKLYGRESVDTSTDMTDDNTSKATHEPASGEVIGSGLVGVLW